MENPLNILKHSLRIHGLSPTYIVWSSSFLQREWKFLNYLLTYCGQQYLHLSHNKCFWLLPFVTQFRHVKYKILN